MFGSDEEEPDPDINDGSWYCPICGRTVKFGDSCRHDDREDDDDYEE